MAQKTTHKEGKVHWQNSADKSSHLEAAKSNIHSGHYSDLIINGSSSIYQDISWCDKSQGQVDLQIINSYQEGLPALSFVCNMLNVF